MTIFHRIGTKLNTVGGDYTFQVDDSSAAGAGR